MKPERIHGTTFTGERDQVLLFPIVAVVLLNGKISYANILKRTSARREVAQLILLVEAHTRM